MNVKTKTGDGSSEEKTIYEYCGQYKDVLSKDNIEKNLNRYLEELKNKDENHTPSILQINHLRDAITANMVGVVVHLQKTYEGFIILEDLDKEEMNKHLESALYNKFQALGWIPPHIKDVIQLRKSVREQQKSDKSIIKSSQLGVIIFVDPSCTSKNCPCCGENQTKHNNPDMKLRQHRFICKSCGFDTYYFYPQEKQVEDPNPEVDGEKEKFQFLKDVDDPDKVAAYNIAKKIIKVEDIGKWDYHCPRIKIKTEQESSME